VAKGGLQQRGRPAPLLRPQRQFGRKAAIGLGLLLAGALGGLVLGLSLRTAVPTQHQNRAELPTASVLRGATGPDAALSQGGLPKSALLAGGPDSPRPAQPSVVPAAPRDGSAGGGGSDAESLRKNLEAEQARLEALAQARTAAEAQLAQLQAQVAQREILARREAALAALPSVTAPLPNPPRGEAGPRQAGGIGSGTGAAAQLPSGHQRVVLHHRAGSYAASEAAGAMAAQVREAGFDLSETRAVTATPSQRVVRYFHAEDAPAAARLAGRLGRGWALQDFRSYEPLPATGLLEVWLPDR